MLAGRSVSRVPQVVGIHLTGSPVEMAKLMKLVDNPISLLFTCLLERLFRLCAAFKVGLQL